jgi:hypothetical protein
MKKIFLSALLLCCSLGTGLFGNNVQIDSVSYDKSTGRVSFLVSWENAWRQTLEFHDAVWIFCKYRTVNTARWQHVLVKTGTTQAAGLLETKEVNDQLGFFVRLDSDSLGHVKPTKVSFVADGIVGLFPDFKVFGIEMVYVPTGSFYAGTSGEDSQSVADYKYFHHNRIISGSRYDPINITSENALQPSLAFQIYNTAGTVPATFPKGYAAFYCMKHEITFALVRDFANCVLSSAEIRAWSRGMVFWGSNNYKVIADTTGPEYKIIGWTPFMRKGASEMNGEYKVASNLPPNWFFSILYWSGLAPMTELQYEKACRGPMYPVRNEQASGEPMGFLLDDTTFIVARDSFTMRMKQEKPTPVVDFGRLGQMTALGYRAGFTATSTTNRVTSNASFYGILNLSDGVMESVITCDSASYKFFNGRSRMYDKLDRDEFINWPMTYRGGYSIEWNETVSNRIRHPETSRQYRELMHEKGIAARAGKVAEGASGMGRGVRKPD